MMSDRRHPPLLRHSILTLLVIGALGLLSGCGSDGEGIPLSEAAQRGRDITRSNGCAACHGSNGEGGVGPSYVGLFGSEVELEDGTTVVADRDYLRESIMDPNAKEVAGFGVQMPTNNLSSDEVESVVDYIVELAEPDGASALSQDARRGADLHRANGCVACHGAGGEGGAGGAYVGLFGSERELADGTTVTADREYLLESITDPSAKLVAGAAGQMPDNDLSVDEADAIVDFIVELGEDERD